MNIICLIYVTGMILIINIYMYLLIYTKNTGYDGLNPINDYNIEVYRSKDGGNKWDTIQVNDTVRSLRIAYISMADSLNGANLSISFEIQ